MLPRGTKTKIKTLRSIFYILVNPFKGCYKLQWDINEHPHEKLCPIKNRHKWAIHRGKKWTFLRSGGEGCLLSNYIFTHHISKHGKQMKMC